MPQEFIPQGVYPTGGYHTGGYSLGGWEVVTRRASQGEVSKRGYPNRLSSHSGRHPGELTPRTPRLPPCSKTDELVQRQWTK